MKIEVTGDALAILEDFLHYGAEYPEDLADAMFYDFDGFRNRLCDLQIAFDKAQQKDKR